MKLCKMVSRQDIPKINDWVYHKDLKWLGKVVAYGYDNYDGKGHRSLSSNGYSSYSPIHGIVIRIVGSVVFSPKRTYVKRLDKEFLRNLRNDYFTEPVGYYEGISTACQTLKRIHLTDDEKKKYDALLFIDDLKGGMEDETKN